jgi:cell wall-associated NlpC family hydrolase
VAFGLTAVQMQPVEAAAVTVAAPPNRVQPAVTPLPPPRVIIQAMHITVVPKGQLAVDAAMKQVGKPYLWGSKGPNSFDCSGLVQWSYRQVGVTLGPDTYTQVNEGVPVHGAPRPGDLVFPARSMGSQGPKHVVLAISATQAVEAPGRGLTVRVIPMPAIGAARRVA